ncbi:MULTISPECIES: hypothetical protein [unclassified Pseudoalteromonas]|uniref:hypothetical protein n=1 Tax=unclassified Pseudoalteromonas TaxID=194690 RepID=UPI0016014858|nr:MULTISPECIES: hypothetical protein [unclassified Pseudoalteromonas]MBB1294966.1 hypothetical protein [Pseudoalteromonas sp. SR41-4]MBB1410873.1 hypothetical protein [Pseudoalteromonas sp. SG44-17]
MNKLKRIFKVGAREIDAPLPNGSLQENVDQLMINFPMFRFTHILEVDGIPQSDGSILYEVELPPCKTNG